MSYKPVRQTVLIKSSSATDVKYSGREIVFTGAKRPITLDRIVSIKQEKFRAEVVQVYRAGTGSYTPAASTEYSILLGDPLRVNQMGTEYLRKYAYTTPADLTAIGANAADQREYIHGQIITKINATTGNYVTAATLTGGAGIAITDDAGYYPVPYQGVSNRRGVTEVVMQGNSDGSGWTSANGAVYVEGVYSFGVGADLLAMKTVIDQMTGNIISGLTPDMVPVAADGTYAVSGQKYDGFRIQTLETQAAHNITGQLALTQWETIVYVDNGTGTSTSNLAGFIAFERAFHRIIANRWAAAPQTLVEFFDKNFVIQGPLGAVPATTTSVKNKFLTPYGMLNHVNIGTQTIVAPTQGANGLLIEQDATATEGAQYSAEVVSICPQEFVVGKHEVTLINKFSAATVANIVYIAGLRTKAAFALDFNDYTNMAAAGTGPSGTDLYTYGILANAATMATDTTANAADATEVTIIIKVALNGLVSLYINGTKYPVYSAGTTPLVFAADTVLIPFFQYTNLNSAAAVPNVTELLAVPSADIVIL